MQNKGFAACARIMHTLAENPSLNHEKAPIDSVGRGLSAVFEAYGFISLVWGRRLADYCRLNLAQQSRRHSCLTAHQALSR